MTSSRSFPVAVGLVAALACAGLAVGCGPPDGRPSPGPETPAAGPPAAGNGVAAWSQWRGPHRDGRQGASWLPAEWPPELTRAWRREAPAGHSAPVAADGRLYVHGREGDDEVVSCLDAASGETLWTDRYRAPFERNQYALAHPNGPFSTPAVAAGRLYTLGVSGILSCYDAAGGELLWRHDHSAEVTSEELFTGTAASPLVAGGLVFAHLGDDRAGALVALDAVTGEERWRWQGAGPGYASPVIAEIAGTRQLVTLTDRSLVGVRASDGELLWSLPFADEWNENIATPLVVGERVIYGGVRRGLFAVEPRPAAGGWQVEEIWQHTDLPLYMSTPVVEDGVVYGLSNRRKGQLFALAAADGELLWTTEGREGDNAALVAAGDTLLVFTVDGDLLVGPASATVFEPAARYRLADSAVWAHPLPVPGGVVVRSADALVRWSW